MPTGDIYLLGRSPSFPSTSTGESQVNLALQPNVPPPTGTVRGRVTDTSGNPIAGATVKLLTEDGEAVDHTFTNSAGNYIFNNVPPEGYLIVAINTGFLLSSATAFTLLAGQTIVINITLTADTAVNRNVIFGLITSTVDGSLIAGATFLLVNQATGAATASTQTDSAGQYIVYAIPDGTYQMTVSAPGFVTSPIELITVSGGALAEADFPLTPFTSPSATVNGFITSNTGSPLANACVGLYTLTGSHETLIQLTFSDSRGFYLFGEVAAGTYVVKAKLEGDVLLATGNIQVA